MSANKIDFGFLERAYFALDEPVRYNLEKDKFVMICPIMLRQSEIFLSCIDIFTIDKNVSPDVAVIQMSYLDFMIKMLLMPNGEPNQRNIDKFFTVLKYCLKMENAKLMYDENKKPFIFDEESKLIIKPKQFDDIRRIILYQNILYYDDEYVNPEFKQAMSEVDVLKNKNIDFPKLERKIAIITAHTGISKKEQLEMTFRSHTSLFDEVCGEVEFITIRPVALYAGKADDIQWIFKKKKGKFDGYYTTDEDYNKSMGGDGHIVGSKSGKAPELLAQFNSITTN